MALKTVMCDLPLSIPDVMHCAEFIRETIAEMNIQEMFDQRFPGVVGLEDWCPRITIIPSVTGQHDLAAVFIDATIECDGKADRAHGPRNGQYYQHWGANTAFSSREFALFGQYKFSRLVRYRIEMIMHHGDRWRTMRLGESDQVNIYADDNPPWLYDDDASPCLVVE